MKNSSTKVLLFFILAILLHIKSISQTANWTDLTTVQSPTFGSSFSIDRMVFNDINNIYVQTQTGCFGVEVLKYKNNIWSDEIYGCDESFLTGFHKDSLGNLYVLFGVSNIGGIHGNVVRLKRDTLVILDTSVSFTFPPYNSNAYFTVSKTGRVFVGKSQITNSVYEWDKLNNHWSYLKGAGNDTLRISNPISGIYSYKDGNPFVRIKEGSAVKFMKWNGTAWFEMGINSGYINTGDAIEDVVNDNNGNFYGYGTLSASGNQEFRAKWDDITSTWQQLPSNSTNPYSYNCIKFSSVINDKFGNIYGISKCLNSGNHEFVAKWNGSSWQELGNLNANAAINSIAVDTNGILHAVGAFTNASGKPYVAKYDVIAPIKLANFTANREKNSIFVKWQTVSEINTLHFNILRSSNGKDFEKIGTITAKGEGKYVYENVINGWDFNYENFYYKLEIVDKDGSKTYSNIQVVQLVFVNAEMKVYPNPANSYIYVSCLDAAEIWIVDYSGRIVNKTIVNAAITKISVNNISNGNYLIKAFTKKGDIKTEKFIKN